MDLGLCRPAQLASGCQLSGIRWHPAAATARTKRDRSFPAECSSRPSEEKEKQATRDAQAQKAVHLTLRRHILLSSGAAVAAGAVASGPLLPLLGAEALADVAEVDAPAPAPAAAPFLELYENTKDNYSLLVPKEWEQSSGSVGTRSLVAFHPLETTTANVSVLITPLGADFTSLGSFGTAEAFGETLVNGLDRSYLRKPGQKAVLISTKSAKDMYLVEYTVQKPGEAKVHLLSAIAVNFNGIYNRLFTLTAQYLEEDASKYESTIREVFSSFLLRKKDA